jgi:ABC-type uncharacterized transport system fused permease/ATPase subunit
MTKLFYQENSVFKPVLNIKIMNSSSTLIDILVTIIEYNRKHIIFIDWDCFYDKNLNNIKTESISEFLKNFNFNGIFFISNNTYNNLIDYEYEASLVDCFADIPKTIDFTSKNFKKQNYYLLKNDNTIDDVSIIDESIKKIYGQSCNDIEIFYITKNFCNFINSIMSKKYYTDVLYNFTIIYAPLQNDEKKFNIPLPKINIIKNNADKTVDTNVKKIIDIINMDVKEIVTENISI